MPVGTVFSRFTVTGEALRVDGELLLPVLCQCGTSKWVSKHNLLAGRSQSCGCLNAELVRARCQKYPTGSTATYSIWFAMVRRCTNPADPNYKNYGGRGVAVCPRWSEFMNFYDDMGVAPKGLSLDRLDNSLGYSKANCDWVSRRANLMNRRNTVRVDYRGEQKTLYELSALCGVPWANLYKRLFVEGRSVEDAMRPVKFKSKNGQSVWNLKLKKETENV